MKSADEMLLWKHIGLWSLMQKISTDFDCVKVANSVIQQCSDWSSLGVDF